MKLEILVLSIHVIAVYLVQFEISKETNFYVQRVDAKDRYETV